MALVGSKVLHLDLKSGSNTLSKVLRMRWNHLKGMLKHISLGPSLRVSDSRSLE